MSRWLTPPLLSLLSLFSFACSSTEELIPVRGFASKYRVVTRLLGNDCDLDTFKLYPRQEAEASFGRDENGELVWRQRREETENDLWTLNASICRLPEQPLRLCLAGIIRQSYQRAEQTCLQRLLIPAERPAKGRPRCCGDAPEGFVLEASPEDEALRGEGSLRLRWRQSSCGPPFDCTLGLSMEATPVTEP